MLNFVICDDSTNILDKLSVTDRVQAAVKATKYDL